MTDLTDKRLQRIEDKLDQLHQAMISLARIEERQAVQAADTGKLNDRVDGIVRRVEVLESRTGWLPAVERLFWVMVAACASWAGRFFG